MNTGKKPPARPSGNAKEGSLSSAAGKKYRTLSKYPPSATSFENKQSRLEATLAEVENIRLRAKRELALAKKIRLETERYQQEAEAKARSQAQLFVLQARLTTQKEIAALKRRATEEVQKILVELRTIRITAQEELEIQHQLTNAIQSKLNSAARIKALSAKFNKETDQQPEKETVTA